SLIDLAKRQLSYPSLGFRMFFSVNLHVRFGQRVNRISVLSWIEDQVSIARPDNAALVEITEIVVDLFRIWTIGAIGRGEANEPLIVAIDRILSGVEIGHCHIVRYPAQAGRIELCPAVVALILILAHQVGFEKRAVDDLRRDADAARE